MILRRMSVMLVFAFASLGISQAFAENQAAAAGFYETINPLFKDPFAAITIVGVLSLVISLIVFSASWRLRDKKSKDAMAMDKITENLKCMRKILGESAFSNLISGLSQAAKEELVFPEPMGVLRHKEFRRALTISVAITYFTFLGFSVSNLPGAENLNDNPAAQAFVWVFVAVIAFYFGDKIFENYARSRGVQTDSTLEPITVEEAKIDKEGKKLTVKVRNNLKSKIEVTSIKIDDVLPDSFAKFPIEGEKSESKSFEIKKGGKTVKIEVGSITVEKESEIEKPQAGNGT
ncbi:MAG: hypothetical protein EPO63_07645 [Candidatus Nitrosotenuis sp.]|nr:MAG: hypothetical protein EPO63_07645 [Candidatus Nitrosotenuis sp.]